MVKEIYPDLKATILLEDTAKVTKAKDVWALNDTLNACQGTASACLTGNGVKIAIIDTGIDYTHPDFGSCTTQQFTNKECAKVVGGYDFVSNDNDPMDDERHGTHVASIAAGKGVLKGIAPDATIYAYKVMDNSGSGTISTIISGIERAMDPNQDGDTSDHVDVINLSLGSMSGSSDDALSQAVDNASDLGVTVVVAAGNSGPENYSIGSPGTARNAITVGATYKKDYCDFWFSCNPGDLTRCGICGSDGKVFCNYWGDSNPKTDEITVFSSRGPTLIGIMKPDIVAPGAIICAARFDDIYPVGQHPYYQPCIDDKHVQLAGTSMAAPVVAGATAIIKQKNPAWTPSDIKQALKNSADEISNDVLSQGGGRLNLLEAIRMTKQPIANIYKENSYLNNDLKIIGTAKADDFLEYSIYYGSGLNPTSWKLLQKTPTRVENSTLYQFSFYPEDQIFQIKLEVKDKSENLSTDQAIYYNNKIIMSGWPIKGSSGYGFVGAAKIANTDSDEAKELIQGEILHPPFYLVKKDGTKKIIFNPDFGSFTPAFGDIRGDGNKEIAVASYDNNKLYLVSTEGKNLNCWPVNYCINQQYCINKPFNAPIIADLDNNPKTNEIVLFGTVEKMGIAKIMVFDSTGKNIATSEIDGDPSYEYVHANDTVYGMGAVGDIDKDNKNEIIYAQFSTIKAFNLENNALVKKFSTKVDNNSAYLESNIIIGDFDNDKNMEIFLALKGRETNPNPLYSTTKLYLLDSKGKIKPGWPKEITTWGYIRGVIAGDLDSDNRLEILLFDFQKIFIFKSDGTKIAEKQVKAPSSTIIASMPILAEINNDNKPEIIYADSKMIKAYDSSLNEILNSNIFPIPLLVNFIYPSPVISDIDNDGNIELFASSFMPGDIYGYKLPITNNEKINKMWPMEYHDIQNTNNYEFNAS